jgi:pre-mRNA-splicing factor CWC22
MASPNFTHVYAALIAVINTKVPEIGLIIAKRVLIQFKRSFERNNKIVCVATTKMIAHLVNQRILGEYVALQILMILLSTPTEDSV